MNWIEWYRIVAYRDFHDVPRCVLVADSAEDAFWILDAPFDEDSDAYSPIYTIHDAGRDLAEAEASFERHAGNVGSLPAFGCIPVAHVQFDATQRAALKLTSPPIT